MGEPQVAEEQPRRRRTAAVVPTRSGVTSAQPGRKANAVREREERGVRGAAVPADAWTSPASRTPGGSVRTPGARALMREAHPTSFAAVLASAA